MFVRVLDIIFVRRYVGKGSGSHLAIDFILVRFLDLIFE